MIEIIKFIWWFSASCAQFAKVYWWDLAAHFGLYFSDNAYTEAIEDIQSGMRIARSEVIVKAKAQGIETMALNEGKEFIYNWARLISDKEVSFIEIKE